MSDPADSPAPRPENAEATRDETPSDPPQDPAPAEPHGPETPMGDSRPDAEPAPAQQPSPESGTVPVQAPEPEASPDAASGTPKAEPAPAQAAASPAPSVGAQVTRAPAAVPAPPRPQPPAAPLTAAEYQRQAAYYHQQMNQQRYTPPPNPRWHRPGEIPKPAIVVLVIAVALFGGWAAFHSTGVGIGLSLTGIALLAIPLAAGDTRDLVPRLPGAILVAALWSVPAIRDAGWVVFLCTSAAFLLTPLVLARQVRFSGTAVMLLQGWLEGLAESFRWAKRGRSAGKDGNGEGNATGMRNLWVVLITAALLLVFGGLFAAADSTFADLIVRLMPEVNAGEFILRILLAAILFPMALTWAYTAVAKPSFDSVQPEGEHRTVSRFELSIPLGALNLLFVAFIAVQLRVFLGGEDYVMETAGLTFAEYARKGFWQLSFVAALSLGVIAVAAWLAPKRAKADRLAARILLGTLCALSMVVIASALYRMFTYADTYGLTRMRVWIFTVEIWLAVLFAMVIVCCWKLRATWLPRAVLASGALALLGLAAANPDALIARYNLEHDHTLDLDYLEDLSDDAVPEFASLPDEDLDCMLDDPVERDLMAWNLGHQRAAGLLEEHEEHEEHSDYCDWGDDRYMGAEEFGDPPPEDLQETEDAQETVGADDAAAPPAAAFFQVETCDALDATSTSEWFGSEVDELGLEPGASDAFLSEEPPVTAWLSCGYFNSGVTIEGQLRYTESSAAASGHIADAVDAYSGGDWLVQERSDGYCLSYGDGAERQFQYYRASGNLVFYALVTGVSRDVVSEAAADELTDQMEGLYGTFA
ncbi:DUF4173 domain-containing protein [Glycomyces luteolus]|uniref:DUF4173 domain-containing protein n=1 Tax=Glycomyces luteolus TaxID=2670330 RepID=A0A9X3P8H4_9ACTN|nr:DUF4153 domain-containing protein [Glycomyces luteolus]MDA1358853.1 DUF4173 domain-containing protein [Glycomyces luteolus]